ncbi:MAG: adenosylcobalamin-dependent ribonucleoside-diphosphate reductase [Hyphomicrobiaceae bacterium]|nr:adenosylcobalamin-dependent ribonucleoside-diphosphate reductase [Hyphomicrobiaceae bacterium]
MSTEFQVECPISQEIWDMKYRFKHEDGTPRDVTLADTWARVATAIARPERRSERARWTRRFESALSDYAFLPAGRILAGAGTSRNVTLFNCFVMGLIEDDLGSIFENVKEAALTMQQGGGIGHDFSSLRPKGALVASIGAQASGPVSFMDVWDAMCRTIMSAGTRRGAMMGTMRCDHPDIEEFIAAKSDAGRLRMFNLSVLVTDDFMSAVKSDKAWDLTFGGRVYKTVGARELWNKILRGAYDYAEPGVIFIDRINALNPLSYCESIYATNPCGEQPLPPYGACLLGSINLARLVRHPFSDDAALDEKRLGELVPTAVRFLDNTIDVSNFPLEAQRQEALAKRRIGLGVTGLADALIMCGQRYGSKKAAKLACKWMALIERSAYLASAELAAEKGAFPLFDAKEYLATAHIQRLDKDVRKTISALGLRNGLLTSIAPTGTISLLAGNVSSGVEPVFDFKYTRRVLAEDGSRVEEHVEDYAHRLYRHMFGPDAPLPKAFVTTNDLSPDEHLRMQAALQQHVDSAISKTVNCPEDMPFEEFRPLYEHAFEMGLKGCTAYRPNPITGSVLSTESIAEPARDTDERQESLPLSSVEVPVPVPVPLPPAEHAAASSGEVVYMSEPLERAETLPGFTYKLKWPDSDHAIYVTLNDIIQDGRRRPFEIFINSKNLEHYAWTVALTRMISAVFRRGGDVSFVVEELKAVFDPRGGQWMEGRYVPSLLAAIGGIIERHMIDIGFITPAERIVPEHKDGGDQAAAGAIAAEQLKDVRYCPKCSQPALVYQEGCHTCRACGFSKCS